PCTSRATDSANDGPIFPLARRFRPIGPNQLWVGETTYIRIAAGFVYLAVIMDARSRRLMAMRSVGRAIRGLSWRRLGLRSRPDSHRAAAFTTLIAACSTAPNPYRRVLAGHRLVGSMSRWGRAFTRTSTVRAISFPIPTINIGSRSFVPEKITIEQLDDLCALLYYALESCCAALKYGEFQGQSALPVDLRTWQRLCQPS